MNSSSSSCGESSGAGVLPARNGCKDSSRPRSASAISARSVFGGEGSVSPLGTALNISTLVVGFITLQLGAVMKQAGIVAGIACMLVSSAICCWTFTMIPNLMRRSMELIPEWEREGEPMDLPLIGWAAFGKPGKAVMTCFFICDLAMASLVLQVSCGGCLQVLFPSLSKATLIGIGGICGIFMQTIPDRYLSMASAGGVFAIILFVISVIVSGCVVEELEPRPLSDYTLVNMGRVPTSFAMMCFANIAHSQSVTVYNQAKRKSSFNFCVIGAFATSALVYICVGLMGFLAYGSEVQENLMQNIGLDAEGRPIEGLMWMRKLVAALFCMKLQVASPFFYIPLSEQLRAGHAYLADLLLASRCPSEANEEAASKASVAVEVAKTAPAGEGLDIERAASADVSGDIEAETCASSTPSSAKLPVKDVSSTAAEQPKATFSWRQEVIFRCALAIVIISTACRLSDSLERLSDFTGSIIGIGLSVTFAPFFRLVLFRDTLSVPMKIALGLLTCVGFVMQVMGVCFAIAE